MTKEKLTTMTTLTKATKIEPTSKIRPTPRAEDTRRKIYDAALELFREKGFEQTTMRDIAAKAQVALGGAYYYFPSKDAIVLDFYRYTQESSHEVILEDLAKHRTLKDRIRCVLEKRLELLHPNRKFCAALFRHAPDSADPLSPFSEASRPIREHAVEHMRLAMEGGDVKVPSDLKPRLPYLLWLYQMGLMLFWVYDKSARQARTALLFEKTLSMVLLLIKLASVPLLRPLLRPAGELLKALYGEV